jgi:hypothetical protein
LRLASTKKRFRGSKSWKAGGGAIALPSREASPDLRIARVLALGRDEARAGLTWTPQAAATIRRHKADSAGRKERSAARRSCGKVRSGQSPSVIRSRRNMAVKTAISAKRWRSIA